MHFTRTAPGPFRLWFAAAGALMENSAYSQGEYGCSIMLLPVLQR